MKQNNPSAYSQEYTEQSNKKEKNKSTAAKVWTALAILLLLILITWIILMVRASTFASYDRNSIFLVPANPGFTVNDEKQVWGTECSINLFEDVYLGSRKDITVESSNGDKVIAPGTESEYTFNLKNTGNVAMDYSVAIDTTLMVHSDEVGMDEIPVGVRLRTYSGEYLLGDGKSWVSLTNLENYLAEGTLAVNNYAWYTLEWKWLYEEYVIDENNNLVGPVGDDWDTILGNLSADVPISLEVSITTMATPSADFGAYGGIEQVFDDENTHISDSEIGGRFRLWPIILLIVLILLVVIIAVKLWSDRNKNEEDETETDTEEGEEEDSRQTEETRTGK